MKFQSRVFSAVGAVACATLVFAGAASSATADVAPDAPTSPNFAFRVPLVNDPVQTEVHVRGDIVDPYWTDNLGDFTIILGCDGLAPVPVSISSSDVDTTGRTPVLHASIQATLPLEREGGLCRIETTSPTTSRTLVFAAPSTKPGASGDSARLYFSGTVLFTVTTRGGAY